MIKRRRDKYDENTIYAYIKLSKNQEKSNEGMNHINENIENYKIDNSNCEVERKSNFKGKRFLDKREKSDKQKILNVKSEERFLNKSYKNVEENYKKEDTKNNIKKLLTKNQVALYAIALMLITSGYFNYNNNLKMASLGDAQLVNSNIIDESEISNETSQELIQNSTINEASTNPINDTKPNETTAEPMQNTETSTASNIVENNNSTSQSSNIVYKNETEQTSNKVDSKEYFTQTKLERDKMYSQMIETYEKILENNNISTEQKNTASEEIKNINNKRNGIATSETLIKAKGIEEIVIIVNSDVIDAIVKSNDNLTQEQVAQVSNIISRELGANIENIHITTHK